MSIDTHTNLPQDQTITNHALNVLKAFACIAVVFIHVTFPGKTGHIIKDMSGWAVPIFYMISGYYTGENNPERIKKKLLKTTKIFLYAYLCHLIFHFFLAALNHSAGAWLAENYTWKTPIKYLLFCTVDFAVPLWYLIGSIETYVFWYYVVKRNKENAAMKALAFLFAMRIAIFIVCETYGLPWYLKINFATCSLPWFLAGKLFSSEKGQKYTNAKMGTLILIAIAGAVIMLLPTILETRLRFSCIGVVPLSFCLFLIAVKCSARKASKALAFVGSELSMNVYVFHPLIAVLCKNICCNTWHMETVWYSWTLPLFTALASIFFAQIIGRLKRVRTKE